jgi:hypothetical protein
VVRGQGAGSPCRRKDAGTLAAALLLTVWVASCATAGWRTLSDTLPGGIPTARERARWERIDGDYDSGADHVRYALFVDPERPLLFRLTQYRVSTRNGAGGGEASLDADRETVIWNATPGERAPLRCFIGADRPRAGGGLGRAAALSWQDVDPASLEFRAHMGRALQIYARVSAEGRAGPRVR